MSTTPRPAAAPPTAQDVSAALWELAHALGFAARQATAIAERADMQIRLGRLDADAAYALMASLADLYDLTTDAAIAALPEDYRGDLFVLSDHRLIVAPARPALQLAEALAEALEGGAS